MSKEQTDTIEVNDVKVSGTFYWDGLNEEQAHVTKSIMSQQALVLELSKKFESILNKDQETFQAVDGLMKSIHDIAIGVSQLQAQHKDDNGAYLTGEVSGDDDIMTYLRIGSGYISAEENLANMIATAYLDIFTKLSTDTSQLDELADLKDKADTISGVANGSPTATGTKDGK